MANQVSFTAIARIVDKDGNLLGCRLVRNDDKGTKDATGGIYLKYYPTATAQILQWIAKGIPFTNLTMTSKRELKGVGGDLSRYTAIDNDTSKVVGTTSFVILKKIADKDAYTLCDYTGKVIRVKTETIAEKCNLANGKICVSANGTKYIAAISGEFEQEVTPQQKLMASQPVKPEIDPIKGALKEGETIENPVKMPEPPPSYEVTKTPYSSQNIYTLSESYAGDVDLSKIPDKNNPRITLEEKLIRAKFTLRIWSPFHYTLYERMTKVVSTEIDTMAVNTKEFIINPDFLGELTEGQLMFVIYHELGHVFYGHTARRGERDPELWNVAADIIVNDAFAKQFNLVPGESKKAPNTAGPIKEIAMLDNCLYYPEYDSTKTSVEEVYNALKGKITQSTPPAYRAGTAAGKKVNYDYRDNCDDATSDYKFDYRLGAEAAVMDMRNGYTLQKAYNKGYNDANRGKPQDDTSSWAAREQEVYTKAYNTAKQGGTYAFVEEYFNNWGAYWRGTGGFDAGYISVVNNAIDTYRKFEDGVAI